MFDTHRVLDIGTGTGIWAINFGKDSISFDSFVLNLSHLADEHPEIEVYGIDLSPIQPELYFSSLPMSELADGF